MRREINRRMHAKRAGLVLDMDNVWLEFLADCMD